MGKNNLEQITAIKKECKNIYEQILAFKENPKYTDAVQRAILGMQKFVSEINKMILAAREEELWN